ncbi:uncharacterized protein ACIB01_011696 isoform 1-T1 [Guaruba guarouba]
MSNAWLACRWGNQSHGHQRETFPSGMAPLPGRAPKQRHAGPRGQPVAEVLHLLKWCMWQGPIPRLSIKPPPCVNSLLPGLKGFTCSGASFYCDRNNCQGNFDSFTQAEDLKCAL